MHASGLIRIVVFALLWAIAMAAHLLESAILTVAFGVGFFVALHVLSRRLGLGGMSDLGFRVRPGWTRHLTIGFAAGVLFYAAVFAVVAGSGRYSDIQIRPLAEALPTLLLVFLNHAYVGLWEEALFRGYLLATLPKSLTKAQVAAIVGTVFMLSHLTKFGTVPLIHFASWFIMGIVYLIPYWRTGTLWLSAGMHWGGNVTFSYLLSSSGLLEKSVAESYSWAADYYVVHIPMSLLFGLFVWFALKRAPKFDVREEMGRPSP